MDTGSDSQLVPVISKVLRHHAVPVQCMYGTGTHMLRITK